MPYAIDETHDPKLESWVESANDPETDFPIQNLPFCCIDGGVGRFSTVADPQIAVRVGNCVILIAELIEAGVLSDLPGIAAYNARRKSEWLASYRYLLSSEGRWSLRRSLQALLAKDNPALRDNIQLRSETCLEIEGAVVPAYVLPFEIGDYTDFYASVYHATNVGSMFRPDNPLLPNYKWIPVGYHGRASSVVPSGTPIVRPNGQQAPAEEGGSPAFGPCKMLDYEMEMGAIIGRGNELGRPVTMAEAEDHILGLCILNDWSARDLQKWEYVPLGPFLAKNFASTVSPYIVTMEALAPFRCGAMERPAGDPQPLPHLDAPANREAGGFDITLEVSLATKQMRDKGMSPQRLSRGNFRDMYWTIAQMIAHHTSGGCNLQPGDLLGSGTISGKTRDSRGSLLELTWDGDPFANPPKLVPGTARTPIEFPTGETRKFLEDGDEVIMRAYCEREGFRRIGFGECRGIIEPSPKM